MVRGRKNRAKGPRQLGPKQRKFVEEYLIDLSAPDAAIRAGYKHRTEGAQLLLIPHVSAAVGKALAERNHRTQLTQDEVVAGLRREANDRVANDGRTRVKALEVLARIGGFISDLHFHKHNHQHQEAQQKLTVSSQEVIDQLPLEAKLTMLEAIAKARAQKAQSSLPKLTVTTELSPPPHEEALREAHPEALREASREAHPEAFVIDVEAQVVELPESSS